MAALVSHAMRRLPTSPSDTVYSSYGLRGESSPNSWKNEESGESALSRSMRYADPWLYGSVRAPGGLLLAPAFVLCTCSDYVNGTKRSSKKSPSTCKKCKGTRLPLSAMDSTKFGTVRCYPTAAHVATSTPLRAGTMRVNSSSSRPSILPSADPYDLMRRSRLSVSETTSQFRTRSISPNKKRSSETRSHSASRSKGVPAASTAKQIDYNSTFGRRSILECDINPYELMSAESNGDASITFVSGQRIRVRPRISDQEDYEEVQVRRPNKPNEKESECGNRFKSILKKPTTTFSDTDLNGPERTPSPALKSGSHFYIPMPCNTTPRKKVQFLVENELVCQQPNNRKDDLNHDDEDDCVQTVVVMQDEPEGKESAHHESQTDAKKSGGSEVVFNDTMALRNRKNRSDSRSTFKEKDLERLDGITSRTRKISPINPAARPNVPPPPPPPPKIKEEIHQKIEEVIKVPVLEATSPPSAPPRKRSNNKQPQVNLVNSVRIESPTNDYANNKTVVQINGSIPAVHKLQIKNDFSESVNVRIMDNPQRKTSILINGDDCYSTVNVNDDIPLYQSSVVVNDCSSPTSTTTISNRKSSTVYITNEAAAEEKVTKEEEPKIVEEISSSALLKELLRDPVEAVRRNLVPHVCGKSDVTRRPRDLKFFKNTLPLFSEQLLESPLELEDSFIRLRNYESISDDVCSEHSSSTQYELIDPGSDCYTDHSNRSSVTEEELANRTKFYELLADSASVEVFENEDHHYESIKINNDPIYEEIEIPPPLPANPPPTSLPEDFQLDKEFTTRSIFEGASKYDILSYLVDAKERGIVQEDSYTFHGSVVTEEEAKEPYNRVSHMSTVSDSSEDNSLIISIDDKATFQKAAEVERNDSGVGSETSKSSLSKYRTKQETSMSCEDCECLIELNSGMENEPLLCRKCVKKRSERKEIITEIVETEEKYSRDLQIILEEFYQPMLVAGLLTPDQLSAIFLNAEELLENSQALAERLRDAVEIALEQGDDDLLTVNIGKLFLEAAPMLHAFETYCVRQGSASLLLASLEKDKELLRIFLKVSQMENTMLRRMNLNSFLMVPVQRVTKYPLLLARLYKVTPNHHNTRDQLKESQHKIELHLNHMNSETKDVPSKLWRRIGSSSGRRSSTEMDLVNIKLRKIAVDVLEWNHDEAKFALEGKLLFTQPSDNNWRKGRTIKLTSVNALLVINGKPGGNKGDRTDENGLVFSRNSGIREAALLLVRDKNGRYSLLREPLYLDRCVIAADPTWQSYFEVQELLGKDTFIFKAEDEEQTNAWYRQLQFHAQGMGAWRKRRNALANIMINGMGLRS